MAKGRHKASRPSAGRARRGRAEPRPVGYEAMLLDNMSEAVLGLDERFLLRAWNRAAERIYGWKAEEVLGKPILRVLRTEYPAGTEPARLASLMEDGRILLEVRQYRKDGTPVDVEGVSVAVRDPGGAITGYVAVNRDVTERKRAEEAQRKLREQLVQADRMASMGALAAGVAHEINNPLAYVVANVGYGVGELRAAGVRPPVRGEAAAEGDGLPLGEILAALEEAREGTERVRAIVRDLKTFSRAEEDVRAPLDVRRVLASSINLARAEIRSRARLATDLGDVPAVEASEHRLGQVFLNLLINAAQAIPEGRADAHEIRAVTRTDGAGRTVVEIHDTGCGIPAEVLPRIFDPFYTTKPVGVGTGLGLAICHGIVTGLGGEIQVESRPGAGSCFRVVLPGAAGSRAAGEDGAAGATRGRILVVDDEPLVARSIQRILSPPHEVVGEASGRAALARLAREEPFDLVLCDLELPDLPGAELQAEAERRSPGLGARFVFLTEGASPGTARGRPEETGPPRVAKPFDAGEIRDLVGRALARRAVPAAP